MNKILVAITFFILFLVCTMLAEASGRIVFVDAAEGKQGWHIYSMEKDGTKVKCLTRKPGLYEHPRWSRFPTTAVEPQKRVATTWGGVKYDVLKQ
jgi:hypothetical protein